ncbi:MAG: hypothetical protein F2812_16840 [Actinobacteria bacterium]|uniref:Unannotated protein n=1 Tax=freshwater metagenome TaxID=449393 RepID=A0A6J7JLJ6_9ZZZZ|nr:hypothetical protein [Actinomycetota bacterium]MSW93251.1 hypothetical protein [Actinomycetota bacterium]
MNRSSIIESVHVSPLGPALRSTVSLALTPYWAGRGRPAPAPPHRKRAVVAGYATRFQVGAFVETGTYRGDTLALVGKLVARAISIELDERLADLARKRFSRVPQVEIITGDSAQVLPGVVDDLSNVALFWLDGHFSDGVTALGDQVTPIEQELRTVLRPGGVDHIVLIDDERLFDGTDGYPMLSTVRALAEELRPGWSFLVENDIIRMHPMR